MDKLDQIIINSLENQGYQKSATLAAQLGVGERTIRRRMKMLRSKGVLKVVALPNPILAGYRMWAKIGIKAKPGSSQSVALELLKHPSVYFVAQAIGAFDIIIAVRFSSSDRLTHFVNSELTNIPGILSTEVFILAWPRKYYHFRWPSFSNLAEATQTGHEQRNADEIDLKVLGVLSEDGLARPATLKSKLGIGESTIRQHIKKMLDGGLFKLEVVPNPEVMEYESWATIGINVNHRSAQELLDSIIDDPAIYLASVAIGRFNLIVAGRFRNIDSLNEFVNIKLLNIEGISSVETFLHTKPLKYHNINWYDSPIAINTLQRT